MWGICVDHIINQEMNIFCGENNYFNHIKLDGYITNGTHL